MDLGRTPQTETSGRVDLLAVEPVVRRVVAARVRNAHDVDDLVQDTLERLLKVEKRLDRDTVLPFAIVVARNLTISRARSESRRHVVAGPPADGGRGDPEDALLSAEATQALKVALETLDSDERHEVMAHHVHRSGDDAVVRGAVRVRMARSRAKLRLEYVLALRRVDELDLPCRRVLLAISAGDVRRQRALGAGDHILGCPTCAELSEPLSRRSLALTALSLPVVILARLLHVIRAHPVASGGTAVAAGAAAAAAAVLSAHGVAHPAAATVRRPPLVQARPQSNPPPTVGLPGRAPTPAALPAPPTPSVAGLTVAGRPVPADGTLDTYAGRTVTATDVQVQSVVTHDGFWIGSGPTDEVWVELVGPIRALRIVPGERLDFRATIVHQAAGYAAAAGVPLVAGSARLTLENAHIALPTGAVFVAGA